MLGLLIKISYKFVEFLFFLLSIFSNTLLVDRVRLPATSCSLATETSSASFISRYTQDMFMKSKSTACIWGHCALIDLLEAFIAC